MNVTPRFAAAVGGRKLYGAISVRNIDLLHFGGDMRNLADYSLYKCPFIHVEKECGHKLEGPEGYEDVYGIWCACGFRGPVLILEPEYLKLEKM